MSTRTRTVLFTDMADYTAAVSRSDRAGLMRLLTQQEELVAPIVVEHGGRIVKNLGDSFMCLFDAATDAVKAALALQVVLAQPGVPKMRVGLTTGDVEEIDGDAFGDAVNLAARILGQAPASEVWFGPGTRACMNAAELPWEPVGALTLKGIADKVEVFRAVPQHRCWLPDPVVAAVRKQRLIRVKLGEGVPVSIPPDALVLFEGFEVGSIELREVMARLPVLSPANLYLNAYHLSPAARAEWIGGERHLIVGTPAALERAIADARRVASRAMGSDTIVLDGGGADVHLVVSGLALPAVPFAEVVDSYFYELEADGRWMNRSDKALVRVEVRREGAFLVPTGPAVRIDGRPCRADEATPLHHGVTVDVGGIQVRYCRLDQGYVGAMLCDTKMQLGVAEGQVAEVGREPNHPGLSFADRRGQDNLRWFSGPRADKARLSGFTLDRALAGRRQASFEVRHPGVQVTPLHDRCHTYRMSDARPGLVRIEGPTVLSIGEQVVAGTTVVALRGPEFE